MALGLHLKIQIKRHKVETKAVHQRQARGFGYKKEYYWVYKLE
jgi:hypothetical protein